MTSEGFDSHCMCRNQILEFHKFYNKQYNLHNLRFWKRNLQWRPWSSCRLHVTDLVLLLKNSDWPEGMHPDVPYATWTDPPGNRLLYQ